MQLFLFAVLIKLLQVGPQVTRLLFILDARKDHLGVGNLGAWIVDVFFEGCLAPGDPRILVGIAVAVALDATCRAAVEAVQDRADLVLAASPTSWHTWHFLNEVWPASTS